MSRFVQCVGMHYTLAYASVDMWCSIRALGPLSSVREREKKKRGREKEVTVVFSMCVNHTILNACFFASAGTHEAELCGTRETETSVPYNNCVAITTLCSVNARSFTTRITCVPSLHSK